jgi:hypothetical protein
MSTDQTETCPECGVVDPEGREMWICRCDCGAELEVSTFDLVNGFVHACPKCTKKMER